MVTHNQAKTPLYDALKQFAARRPVSFHVPGHKNGMIFSGDARRDFDPILPLDLTELSGLDDLHASQGIIDEAQELAAEFFGADHTHFLIGGSTAGNLAMILAVCTAGDKIIVQRNSHKSIFNALELSGARPVFMAPVFDHAADRYTAPDADTVKTAIKAHPDAKAVILTYPDYFGKTYALKAIIAHSHEYNIPVLIDEAHGVHFSLYDDFPDSALALGADAVVQSAHKMAPAMTMGAYLHVQSARLFEEQLRHYLQMVQSSSPSYPIMASLDLARAFLAGLTTNDLEAIVASSHQVKRIMSASDHWDVVTGNDPLKVTLKAKPGLTGEKIAHLFEQEGIYPELATHNQVLFIHGLAPFDAHNQLKNTIGNIDAQLKNTVNRDIIEIDNLFTERLTELAIDYAAMKQHSTVHVPFQQSPGYIAAEPITPYPPGIPFIVKGERITRRHIRLLDEFMQQGVRLQHRNINQGISVFQ